MPNRYPINTTPVNGLLQDGDVQVPEVPDGPSSDSVIWNASINGCPLNVAPISGLPKADNGQSPTDPVGPSVYWSPALNGHPVSTAPINGAPMASEGQAPEVPVDHAGYSVLWSASVTIDGADVSDRLTGTIRVDRSEGAAGIAEFHLFYPVGTAVPMDLHDSPVIILFSHEDSQQTLFTGWVAEPDWDAQVRVMRITATDMLQQRVERMSEAEVAGLTGGIYSDDVFGADKDDRWRYAQDRLSTRAASLDCSAVGAMRVTSWHAKSAPDYLFTEGSTVYQSVAVKLAPPADIVSRVELTVKYRYPRLWHVDAEFNWKHSAAEGHVTAIRGFCAWRKNSTELPTVDMCLSAVGSAGFVPIAADWSLLPPTHPDPCGTGQPWINNVTEPLLLGAEIQAARRWTQRVTEEYSMVVRASYGDSEAAAVTRRSVSVSVDVEDDWQDSLIEYQYPPTGGPVDQSSYEPGDQPDESRRQSVITTALIAARVDLIGAHRRTTVSWQVPTSVAAGIDLVHTLELDEQGVHARGKCNQRVDELSIETGSALTTLSIAVLRGLDDGENSALQAPPRRGADEPEASGTAQHSFTLDTQIGGMVASPPYDEELDGFSGNYSIMQTDPYPRRFAATSPDIPEQHTDERVIEVEPDAYIVRIESDLLEL